MKRFLLAAGRKIKRIAQAGKRRCRVLLGQKTDDAERIRPAEQQPAPGDAFASVAHSEAAGAGERQEDGRRPVKGKYRTPAKPAKPEWSLDNFQVSPVEGKSRFHDFPIPLPVMRAIADLDFQYCTPIQEKALADVLAGSDLVGKAHTGTGKTAVFLVAILSRLLAEKKVETRKGAVRALVLAPTRELVMQIAKDGNALGKYCEISVTAVFGGADYQKQLDAVQRGRSDVVVATPGRLLDFLGKNVLDLRNCRILVLDEADRMLDMGFIPDVRRIIGRLPARGERQTMLFSATVPDDVQRLAAQWCVHPKVVEAEPEQKSVETVEQIVYLTTTEEKYTVLYNLIHSHPEDRIIVFANMKNEAKRLATRLERNGVECLLLSGDVEQAKRTTRLELFRSGKVKVLVATDVAGRGIHIEGITFVVNYTLPYEPEDYIHRIGRTGRAGASGKAVSFACEEGSFYLPAIEELIDRKLECIVPEEELLLPPPKGIEKKNAEAGGKPPQKSRRRRPRKKSGSGGPPRDASGGKTEG